MTNCKNKLYLLVALLAVFASACTKQWDSRTALNDQQLNKNLMQQINENGDLSTFASYLSKFGYDKLLTASKNFTVWAPTNAALQGLDATIVNDTAKLHQFVNNHIATQVYLTTTISGQARVKTLSGKNLILTGTTVEDATISTANVYVNNGVLHVINKPLTPKMNIWEYVKSLSSAGLLQQDYLKKQDTTFVDTTKATVKSIDPATGKPILVPGTGLVTVNKYFNRVANLAAEDSTYTYFVLTDVAYNAERAKVAKYFTTVTNSTDTTMNMLAAFNVLKDVAVRGAVTQANLPASLTSVNGVPVPVDKSAIVQTYNASNGIVYVISSMNFNVRDKITPIIIQAERPSFFMRTDQGSRIAYRARIDNNNVRFTDMLITGSGLPAQFFAAYKIGGLYTCQYNVKMRAYNDTLQTKQTAISQRVLFGQITGLTTAGGAITPTYVVTFPYANLPTMSFNEFTLSGATSTGGSTINATGGTLNVTKWSSVNMYVQGANSTTANANNVLFDYIKLEPVIQ